MRKKFPEGDGKTVYGAFGISKERIKLMEEISGIVINDTIEISSILISLWNDERITAEELVVLAFFIGTKSQDVSTIPLPTRSSHIH